MLGEVLRVVVGFQNLIVAWDRRALIVSVGVEETIAPGVQSTYCSPGRSAALGAMAVIR